MLTRMEEVRAQVAERDELIEIIAIALLTRKNVFILGDTGQAKSAVINLFRAGITGTNQFERLMSKQTDEEALFGRLDLSSLIPGGVPEEVLEKDQHYQELRRKLETELQTGGPNSASQLADLTAEMEQYRKAVALALLDIAMRDQRRFAVIHFAGVGDVQTDLFLPGQYDREDVLRCAETFLNGNTDYETPLREALRLMEQEGFENADMVFVTDGECVLPDSFLEKLKAEQSARGFQITGILLDQEDAGFEFSLREFCTNVYRTSQLSRDQIAEQLVVSRVA